MRERDGCKWLTSRSSFLIVGVSTVSLLFILGLGEPNMEPFLCSGSGVSELFIRQYSVLDEHVVGME